MPGLIVSGSWARPAGRQLGKECVVGGCDFTAWDCCLKGGHSLGAVRGRPATHLTVEAPLGTVRIGSADTLGAGKGWTGLALEQREPHLVLGKRRGTAQGRWVWGVGVCLSGSLCPGLGFLVVLEVGGYELGKTTLATESLGLV